MSDEKILTADKLYERLCDVEPDTVSGKMDPRVALEGVAFVVISGPRASLIEAWVQGVAEATGTPMDWSWVGGRAVVKTLGSKLKAIEVGNDLMSALDRRYQETDDYAKKHDLRVQKVWM